MSQVCLRITLRPRAYAFHAFEDFLHQADVFFRTNEANLGHCYSVKRFSLNACHN